MGCQSKRVTETGEMLHIKRDYFEQWFMQSNCSRAEYVAFELRYWYMAFCLLLFYFKAKKINDDTQHHSTLTDGCFPQLYKWLHHQSTYIRGPYLKPVNTSGLVFFHQICYPILPVAYTEVELCSSDPTAPWKHTPQDLLSVTLLLHLLLPSFLQP